MKYYFAWYNDDKLVWGPEPKRRTLYKRYFKVVCCSGGRRPNSALVEFENGQREVISRRSMRREKEKENETGSIFSEPL